MSFPLSAYTRMPKQLPYSLGFDRYALHFDGVNDYVYVSNPIKLQPPIALECLAYVTRTDVRYQTMVSRRDPNDRTNYAIRLTYDKFVFYIKDVDTGAWVVHETNSIVTPGWHYFYAHYDGNEVVMVYDGKVVYRANESRMPYVEFEHGEEIGSIKGGTAEFWNGLIAFVRIYNRALTLKEIHYNMLNYHNPVRDGLVLWLDFEEGCGDKVYDKSGYGNHGTIYGGAKWVRVRQYELRAEVGL